MQAEKSNAVSQPKCLHISNFPSDTKEEDLVEFLKDYHPKYVKIIKKHSKLFATAEFESVDIAEKARIELNCACFTPSSSKRGLMKAITLSKIEIMTKDSLQKEVGTSVLVKNISSEVTGNEFYKMLRQFGDIKNIKFFIDSYGNSKGSCHVYYYDSKSADAAINALNGKRFYSKSLVVCNLISGLSESNSRNSIYVKNFPLHFTEDDLKKLFSKYGFIKSIIIPKDSIGKSKGFAFIIYQNSGDASKALKDIKAKEIQFPSCQALYVSYLLKKEEIEKKNNQDAIMLRQRGIFAKVKENFHYLFRTPQEFENEITTAMSLIMGHYYRPKEIQIKMESMSAVITMMHASHVDEFMKLYLNHYFYSQPRILFNYYQDKAERALIKTIPNTVNSFLDPISMINYFSSMSVIDPTKKPIIYVSQDIEKNQESSLITHSQSFSQSWYDRHRPYPENSSYIDDAKLKSEVPLYRGPPKPSQGCQGETADEQEELCTIIFEYVNKKCPKYAGKITGMIIDLGVQEMKRLLEKRNQLDKLIEEANQIIIQNN